MKAMAKSGRKGEGRTLRSWPGPSYDSVYILASAFERAKTVEPDAVVKALEQTDMQGAIGRIKFGKDIRWSLDLIQGNSCGVGFQWVKPGKEGGYLPRRLCRSEDSASPYMKK